MPTRVTVEDLETGETESTVLEDEYVLITDGTCELTHSVKYEDTHVLTVKRPKQDDNG